jgi:hypothetical protein
MKQASSKFFFGGDDCKIRRMIKGISAGMHRIWWERERNGQMIGDKSSMISFTPITSR